MADYQDFKNNVGNYKGLMLCNRPNEEIRIEISRPFISRVDPKDQLGFNKVREVPRNKPIKSNQRVLDVLSRHKQWLQSFKQKVSEQHYLKQQNQDQKQNKQIRLREKALENIDNFKSKNSIINLGEENIAPQISQQQAAQILDNSIEDYQHEQNYDTYENNLAQQISQQKQNIQTKKNKTKQKPEWAYTKEEIEKKQNEEVDDLLDFVNKLDYESYMDDFEVKNMVGHLKNRIDQIVTKHNTLEEAENEYLQNQQSQNQYYQSNAQQEQNNKYNQIQYDNDFDRKSFRSSLSKQSITSMRQEAKQKDLKTKKDWDKSTTCGDIKNITVEDRLVKHIADEILRNNKYLRNIHSNNSIRALLENEAHKQLNEKKQSQVLHN